MREREREKKLSDRESIFCVGKPSTKATDGCYLLSQWIKWRPLTTELCHHLHTRTGWRILSFSGGVFIICQLQAHRFLLKSLNLVPHQGATSPAFLQAPSTPADPKKGKRINFLNTYNDPLHSKCESNK